MQEITKFVDSPFFENPNFIDRKIKKKIAPLINDISPFCDLIAERNEIPK